MSGRRFRVLLRHMPATGAIGRVNNVPESYGWGHSEELLVGVVSLVDNLARLTYKIHAKKGAKLPDPIKIRRPWENVGEDKTKRPATSEEMARYFRKGRPRNRAGKATSE